MERKAKQRVDETRRLEERIAQLRPVLNMTYKDPLYIPPEIIPPGWEYYWVRESIRGVIDEGRIVEMKRKGWTPVPADRHPEMAFDDYLARGTSHLNGFIYHKGLILFERPKEIGDEERRAISNFNNRIVNSLPGIDNLMGDPVMPVRFLANPETRVNFNPNG